MYTALQDMQQALFPDILPSSEKESFYSVIQRVRQHKRLRL